MKYLCTHTHTHTERICGNTQSRSQKEVESWNTQSMGSSFCPHGKGLESSVLVASSLAVNSPLQKFKHSGLLEGKLPPMHPPEPLTMSSHVPGKGVTIQGVGLHGADLDLRGGDASMAPSRVHPGRGLQ